MFLDVDESSIFKPFLQLWAWISILTYFGCRLANCLEVDAKLMVFRERAIIGTKSHIIVKKFGITAWFEVSF